MANEEFLTYKGYPLVRNNNTIYFGNSYDPFTVMMTILTTRDLGSVKVADKVFIRLINTDPSIPPTEMIVKQSEKRGLCAAIELSYAWLEKANASKKQA